MDRGRSILLLAILLSAVPALAQESLGIVPAPTQTAEKPSHIVRHAKAKKRAHVRHIAAPATVVAKSAALSTELAKAKHLDFVDIDSGHWPMFSKPIELARLLAAAAADD